jgi:hypothetical protein
LTEILQREILQREILLTVDQARVLDLALVLDLAAVVVAKTDG